VAEHEKQQAHLEAEARCYWDGMKVRKGWKYLRGLAPMWADDCPAAHAEKNWKRHRRAQYK